MFRAWAEDQGKTTAAVVKAIQNANNKVIVKTNALGEKSFRVRDKV
jgi:RIO-like serine/threonine protein kinase